MTSGDDCCKTEWKGRCCCNCVNQFEVMKHPWNEGAGKGRITETMGYGCRPPEFASRTIIFFDRQHGLCEMHEFAVEMNVGG